MACTPSTGRKKPSTIAEAVDLYELKYKKNRDAEFDYFETLPDLPTAIKQAGWAEQLINGRMKRNSHQRRLKRTPLGNGTHAALTRMASPWQAADFDAIHDITKKIAIGTLGLGALWAYDTALRIGAHLKKRPAVVHLHAGARNGANNLGLPSRQEFLATSVFHPKIGALSPAHIENFLCIFAEDLKALKAEHRAWELDKAD